MKSTEDKKYYDRLNENECSEVLKKDWSMFKKCFLIGLLILFAAWFFASCEQNTPEPILKPSVELSPSITDTTLLGKYESNTGQKNTGSIFVYDKIVSIYTVECAGDFNIRFEPGFYKEDCYIKTILSDGAIIHLSLFRSIKRIHLTKEYKDGSEEDLGDFNKTDNANN